MKRTLIDILVVMLACGLIGFRFGIAYEQRNSEPEIITKVEVVEVVKEVEVIKEVKTTIYDFPVDYYYRTYQPPITPEQAKELLLTARYSHQRFVSAQSSTAQFHQIWVWNYDGIIQCIELMEKVKP